MGLKASKAVIAQIRPRSLLALVSDVAATAACQAGVLIEPHYGWPQPNYFSGTNSRAFFRASVTFPTVHIEEVQILLNNEPTVAEAYTIGGTPSKPVYRAQTTLAVMFDSTHFTDGATVTVRCRAKADGVWHEIPYSAPSDNKSVLYGRYDLDVMPMAWNTTSQSYVFGDYTWISARPAENRFQRWGIATWCLRQA